MRAPGRWGATDAEADRRVPADALVGEPRARWVRAVGSSASPALLWRWVQQLTVAPYSYDLIDNLGRRSPRRLGPDADRVEVGQRLLVLFVVDSVTPAGPPSDVRQMTLRRRRPGTGPVGEFAITYAVHPAPVGCRLVATVVVGGTPGGAATALRGLLAWGDLVMMRRQLQTLAALAGPRRWARLGR